MYDDFKECTKKEECIFMITEEGKTIRTYKEMKELEQSAKPSKTYKEFVEIVQQLVSKKNMKKQGIMFLYWEYAISGVMPTCEKIKRVLFWGEGYYY